LPLADQVVEDLAHLALARSFEAERSGHAGHLDGCFVTLSSNDSDASEPRHTESPTSPGIALLTGRAVSSRRERAAPPPRVRPVRVTSPRCCEETSPKE
jgi:hypothetical protein